MYITSNPLLEIVMIEILTRVCNNTCTAIDWLIACYGKKLKQNIHQQVTDKLWHVHTLIYSADKLLSNLYLIGIWAK